MSETEHLEEVRRWLRHAEEDLRAAEALLNNSEIAPRHICWLAQQCAEKALKAVLVFLDIDFPYSHDLDGLRNLIPGEWEVKASYPDLSDLTEWAVEARYPGDWPDAVVSDADVAIAQAQSILQAVRKDLVKHGFRSAEGH